MAKKKKLTVKQQKANEEAIAAFLAKYKLEYSVKRPPEPEPAQQQLPGQFNISDGNGNYWAVGTNSTSFSYRPPRRPRYFVYNLKRAFGNSYSQSVTELSVADDGAEEWPIATFLRTMQPIDRAPSSLLHHRLFPLIGGKGMLEYLALIDSL